MTEKEWIRTESKMKNLLAENGDLRERLKNCVNCIIAKEKTIDEITMERILMELKIKNLLAENDNMELKIKNLLAENGGKDTVSEQAEK